jgi:tetratricopeptide (TPR) repeat protein
MKNVFFIAILSFILIGCSNSTPKVSEKPIEKSDLANNPQQPETVAAHTLDKEEDAKALPKDESEKVEMIKKSDEKTKWTRSGNPIDVTDFNAEISKAEKDLKAKPKDETAKKNLSEAYTKRGVALTEARQYAAAIGDYRKALKYNAENSEAKKWIETIINIYGSINREVPKEGEEPEALEFNQKTS